MNFQAHGKSFAAILLCSALLIGNVTALPALAEGALAGTLIENTAVASFEDGGGVRTVNSNTVTVRVDELLDLTLTSLDPGPISTRPGDAVLTFEMTHQGNGPEAFRFTAIAGVPGNDFELTISALAVDTNGNGIYDAGIDEILSGPQTTALLTPDTILTLFALVSVPEGVSDTQRSAVDLTAEAITGSGTPGTVFVGQGVGGGDAIVGTTGALAAARGQVVVGASTVEIEKSVTLRDPFGGSSIVPGTVATFTLAARVRGSSAVSDLIVADAIPAGTTYVPGTLTHNGALLTEAADTDAGSASDSDGIRVEFGTVAGGQFHTIAFAVTVD